MPEVSNYVQSLKIGEIGEKNIEVKNSVISLQYELSASEVSQIVFTMHDPGFSMYNRNFFVIGRRVVYNDTEFEIAAVELQFQTLQSCVVTARSRPTQILKRDISKLSFGDVSPTQAAAAAARLVGLNFFGEATSPSGTIVRQEDNGVVESTMNVLSRLASDLQFRFFEARGTLFFSSEENLVAEQESVVLSLDPSYNDPFQVLRAVIRKTGDNPRVPSTVQLNLLKNDTSILLYPGLGLEITGLTGYENTTFMIDRVSFDATPSGLVSVSGTNTEVVGDLTCTGQTFSIGSRDECVKRIQNAVGAYVDGWFGPQTQRLVIEFQNGITLSPGESLGVVGKATWEAIVNAE